MSNSLNEDLYIRLRNQFPAFNYESYNYKVIDNKLVINFAFNIDKKIHFYPEVNIITGKLVKDLAGRVEQIKPLLENIIFNIGMIELISYWKAACPPVIHVKPARLTSLQAEWWKNLYFNGLGEFYYLNSIPADAESFVQLLSEGENNYQTLPFKTENNFLVPIGGGKDSAVTLSLLRKNGYKIMPLIMNPRGATIETVTAAGLNMEDVLTINRTIDPMLLEINNQGFLNGHTPFSAMLAFYTLLCSALTGYGNIVLSNEGSANESTIPGTNINHQYSKSYEFENDFRAYYQQYISNDFNYFSFLRPLSELQIARIFSGLRAFHEIFRSCNAGSKTNSWCGKCPKCMFTHIMLSAFLGTTEADRILGNQMLNDPDMLQIFDELAGFSAIKPFECVGTTEEVKQALQMILEQEKSQPLPFLLNHFTKKVTGRISQPDFSLTEESHFVPAGLLNILKQELQ
ncbi:MAG: hypothetical protein HGA37_04060 [Lentimicrobium sp.]|nr:hypothetical protein [Lentimicrobium sp.]